MVPFKNIAYLVFILLFASSNICNAQTDFASLYKNINVLAKGLEHDLNKSKDTLILKSEKTIRRIYTVGDYGGLVNEKIDNKAYKFPLNQLKKGKYVFVVDQLGLKIVFQVHILKDAIIRNSIKVVSELSRSDVQIQNTVIETHDVDALISQLDYSQNVQYENSVYSNKSKKLRPYNLTDMNRQGMESRETARKRIEMEELNKRVGIKGEKL